ncbi:MAG: 4'-phosphopantetheinyl transferase superfamily protein [Bacteroidetes bacterium]|nr:4'-phosphopantetheinyl transferase superfamily protein [Bacteroidota bacterium]HET6244463.1 4'-phosphopantetheinyl transferase superfamily protein [Bacteroidia bacterium]
MISIFYTYCKEPFSKEVWSRHLQSLPVALHEKITSFKRWQDRQSSLIGKLLLKEALKRNGYSGNSLQDLKYNHYNRPYFDLPMDFNISHSEELVICAWSNKGKIGVDVEAIKPIDFNDLKKAMNEKEWALIQNSTDSLREFYKYWSIKESVLKAEGSGLSILLEDMVITDTEVILQKNKWHIQELLLNNNYSSWIAFNDTIDTLQIEEIVFYGSEIINAKK